MLNRIRLFAISLALMSPLVVPAIVEAGARRGASAE
jgi:hypothetical protein